MCVKIRFSTCFICSDTANKKTEYEQMFSHSDDSPHCFSITLDFVNVDDNLIKIQFWKDYFLCLIKSVIKSIM